ncbi:MAG TPA: FprA family A-type flavoprotein [Spirochaetota bacterium]|nr:FprA family A-type flavoprotein [Spirochaetota bacterium]HPC40412.1 FprA family A-type flavoprotein [Spirochaetota bacterium]HPL18103.1 FprA family A-type flavoprotein [Spirochaetota bacterium]HQF06479.1 FprA family A-type flavoprotein [Spirochaetota bacterium]HQH98064.1 FprA family A-type flavoprotein [Spirochaetota bacterium]
MKAIQIKENIYWVGGIDWDLRNFHGYLTQRGSTYNAYLVIDEKITLVDTVKYYLCEEMITRIKSVVDPSKIDCIISNHVEMDHSGSLPQIAKIAPGATIYTSPNGLKGLTEHYKSGLKLKAVNNGESICTGKYNFNFVLTPMVHWPDNMITYLAEERLLFSNDAFGQHIASSERFDDEYPLDIIMMEARKYYANIVLPYGEQVKKALSAASGLAIDIIAPSHGIIWRKNVPSVLNAYAEWSANKTSNKALIIYDTMWNSTKKLAGAIEKAFENRNYRTIMMNLQTNHISDILTELIDTQYICVGSPTLNNNMLPTVAAFLTYMKGLAPKNRTGLAFGSYGWGGQSIGQIEELLKSCGFATLESIKVKYIPDDDVLKNITRKLENEIQ